MWKEDIFDHNYIYCSRTVTSKKQNVEIYIYFLPKKSTLMRFHLKSDDENTLSSLAYDTRYVAWSH